MIQSLAVLTEQLCVFHTGEIQRATAVEAHH